MHAGRAERFATGCAPHLFDTHVHPERRAAALCKFDASLRFDTPAPMKLHPLGCQLRRRKFAMATVPEIVMLGIPGCRAYLVPGNVDLPMSIYLRLSAYVYLPMSYCLRLTAGLNLTHLICRCRGCRLGSCWRRPGRCCVQQQHQNKASARNHLMPETSCLPLTRC